MTIKSLSLFSCAGIGELLLEKNNIKTVVANELLTNRSELYKYNHPNVNIIEGDIHDENIKQKIIKTSIDNNVEYVQATPPCQGFSRAGKCNKNDIRNILICDTVDIIQQVEPKWVLIENVPEMINNSIVVDNKKIKIIDYISIRLKNYNIKYEILNTKDYGIAQNRKRAIILLSKKDVYQLKFPEKKDKIVTVKDAIGHLPSLESGEQSNILYHYAKIHNDNHIRWMKNTPTGKTAFDNQKHFPQKNGRKIKGYNTTYKRISWDKPSPTITMCNGAISSQNNVHPGRLQNDGTYSDARVLTIHELMILTGIEKLWKIPEWAKDNFIRQMIGECLPPCIPYEITKQLYKA